MLKVLVLHKGANVIYYWESELDNGQIVSENDYEAIKQLRHKSDLLGIYKESDTKDGTPFLLIWEKSK